MSLVPLTVYLPRAQLVQLERRAALAGISRSSFAARVVLAALAAPSLTPETIARELFSLRAETERLAGFLGQASTGDDARQEAQP